MSELHEYTALELHQLLQRREVSPVELAQHYLDRIERLDPGVGAFATVTPEAALERARHVEEQVPTAAPLWGLPLADKDLHRRAGVPARFGSRAFADFVPDESESVAARRDLPGLVVVRSLTKLWSLPGRLVRSYASLSAPAPAPMAPPWRRLWPSPPAPGM